jgi:hypothetical protein
MATDKPENLFDSRVVERNIKRKLITREEYDAYLAGLDDCEPMSVGSSTYFQYSGEAPAQEVTITRQDIKALQDRDAETRNIAIEARHGKIEPAAEVSEAPEASEAPVMPTPLVFPANL